MEIQLQPVFGGFCADATNAAAFRMREIESHLHFADTLVLDFKDVKNVNASFANALLVPIFSRHPKEAVQKIRFKNCNSVVRVVIASAVSMGLATAERADTEAVRV